MALTQENRRIAIETPLGKDELLLRGFTGTEAISQVFHFELELLSENQAIRFQDVVGKSVSLRIYDAAGGQRQWNGFISRFAQGAQAHRLTVYRAEMAPWLWFLTRTADCRIFQGLRTPDIIRKIFRELGFSDFDLRLYGSYTPRDYCVQYRETDFDFVSRLMEEEGICYYFEHGDGRHVLVLADDPAAHKVCANQSSARCDFAGGSTPYEDVVTKLEYREEFRAGKWAQSDYDFEAPGASLAIAVGGRNPYEIYEYPGGYRTRAAGERLAKIRLEEQTVPTAVFQGASGCRYFSAGCRFTLLDHYRADLNQTYLLTSVQHSATEGGSYEAGSGREELTYRNHFECIPYRTPFRPPRVTPQPLVRGCQTAVVVGPGGEEIYTDRYGRVKVQFHWDREGRRNENSSCWVRVSQAWAGQGWGAIAIPRIGQEVIVEFLEGDPDQPIITGRVYNAEQMPPFGLPEGAVVSGMRSNSTKGGGGSNEISLNDTKGTELIRIHAQFDQQQTVEHDERVEIGNDRRQRIGGNEEVEIGGSRREAVHGEDELAVKELTVTSSQGITLQSGAARIVLKNSGEIEISGVNITLQAAAALKLAAAAILSETGDGATAAAPNGKLKG